MDVIRLGPHDPLPDGFRHVVVMRRFAEDDPARTEIELAVARGPHDMEVSRPAMLDGAILGFDAAVREAEAIAGREGLARVYVVDRTHGAPERDVLRHHGDRTAAATDWEDEDREDGESGPDMRSPG